MMRKPNGAMLLSRLTNAYPVEAGPYLDRLGRTEEDIATVAAEAYEVVEELVWQVLTAQHPATP